MPILAASTSSRILRLVPGMKRASCPAAWTRRFVSHSKGWVLEQIVPDSRCDRNGLRSVMFSSSGEWLVSVANELCIWRVCETQRGKLVVSLHQRLLAICGAEGIRSASFCSHSDAIAVGSRDGEMALWNKHPGPPMDVAPADPSDSSSAWARVRSEVSSGSTWRPERQLAKPMQRISLDGIKPALATQTATRLRAIGALNAAGRGAMQRVASGAVAEQLTPARFFGSPTSTLSEEAEAGGTNFSLARPMQARRVASAPDLLRVRRAAAERFRFEDSSASLPSAGSPQSPGKMARVGASEDVMSPMKKSMCHATKRLVHRVTLAPQVIGAS